LIEGIGDKQNQDQTIMKYDYYSLLIDTMEKTIRKTRGINKKSKKKGKAAYKEAMTYLYKSNVVKDLLPSMDTVVLMEENQWINHSDRNVIFPASSELLKSLYEAKCDFSTLEHFKMPHDIFILAMPKGFSIDGIEVKGLLVSYMSPDEREKVMLNFAELAGLGKVKMNRGGDYANDKTLAINYFTDKVESGNLVSPLLRICIPESELLPVLKSQNYDEYVKILGKFNKFEYDHLSKETETDSHLQFIISRLVVMLGVYCSSFPGAIESGYPESKEPKHIEPLNHGKWQKQTVGKHLVSDSDRKAHYRRWFFRQLINERYYKGEHKNKPIGSRIVFVRDTSVNQDINPETLNHLTD